MYPGEEKQTFIKIIEELTAIIEHNPGETIKTALIEGIKAKTQDLKHNSQKRPIITVKTNNLGFAEGKEGEEAQKIKIDLNPEHEYIKPGEHECQEIETKQQPEILRFGEYIKRMNYGLLEAKTIEEHYEEFKQS